MTAQNDSIKSINEVRNTDELVRYYRPVPSDRIYAYKSDDETHTVVASGSSHGENWVKNVPAIVTHPYPKQKLWTIPDNWNKHAHVNGDMINYGIFYVPESDVYLVLSIPTNDHLNDAFYSVKSVGELTVDPVGGIADWYEVSQFSRSYRESNEGEHVDATASAIKSVADNWDEMKTELKRTVEWVKDDGLDQLKTGDQPLHLSSDFTVEFHKDRIFSPENVINRSIDPQDDGLTTQIVADILNNNGFLPNYYKFEISVNDDVIGMDHIVRGLIKEGASPAEALDYYMVEFEGMTQEEWANERGINQPTVSGNVNWKY